MTSSLKTENNSCKICKKVGFEFQYTVKSGNIADSMKVLSKTWTGYSVCCLQRRKEFKRNRI